MLFSYFDFSIFHLLDFSDSKIVFARVQVFVGCQRRRIVGGCNCSGNEQLFDAPCTLQHNFLSTQLFSANIFSANFSTQIFLTQISYNIFKAIYFCNCWGNEHPFDPPCTRSQRRNTIICQHNYFEGKYFQQKYVE